jgi:hypothetical protein
MTGFTVSQLSALTSNNFAELFSSASAKIIAADKIAWLSPANAATTFGDLVEDNKSSNAVQDFGSKVSKLSATQLGAFSPEQLAAWDAWEWTFFSSQQIAAFSTSQITALASVFNDEQSREVKGWD